MIKKLVKDITMDYINEEYVGEMILYRGIQNANVMPDKNSYDFFAKDLNFAKDYGDYIYKCYFRPMNLFISYELNYLEELYNNDFKLIDNYIEYDWNYYNKEYKLEAIYDYDENNSENNGYKSAKDFYESPFSGSDTWEIIEHSDGVVDYILSKYDGIALLEGGMKTYLLDTSKLINYELI